MEGGELIRGEGGGLGGANSRIYGIIIRLRKLSRKLGRSAVSGMHGASSVNLL